MEWIQVLTIAGSTIGSCWFMHKEQRKDSLARDKEMKDFHGRLCTLEERYLQLMQKMWENK